MNRARAAFDVLAREAVKFGAVGAVAFVVDLGLFNLLLVGFDGQGLLAGHPKAAKAVSATVATLVAWLGNRLWTFRHRRQASGGRELALFFGFNVAGMAIAVACQTISHDVLGFTSLRADNISANGVGLVLGTLFRFWAYRKFVFSAELAADPILAVQTETPLPEPSQ
jgi:putative flippase GtrA